MFKSQSNLTKKKVNPRVLLKKIVLKQIGIGIGMYWYIMIHCLAQVYIYIYTHPIYPYIQNINIHKLYIDLVHNEYTHT